MRVTNINYIYFRHLLNDDIMETYAYTRLNDNKFIIIKLVKSVTDKNDKEAVKRYAYEKLSKIYHIIVSNEGKPLLKNKKIRKFVIDSEKLRRLKCRAKAHKDAIHLIRNACKKLKHPISRFVD